MRFKKFTSQRSLRNQRIISCHGTIPTSPRGEEKDLPYFFQRLLHLQLRSQCFVFPTARLHRVQDVVELAFKAAGLGWQPEISFEQTIAEMVQAELQPFAS